MGPVHVLDALWRNPAGVSALVGFCMRLSVLGIARLASPISRKRPRFIVLIWVSALIHGAAPPQQGTGGTQADSVVTMA